MCNIVDTNEVVKLLIKHVELKKHFIFELNILTRVDCESFFLFFMYRCVIYYFASVRYIKHIGSKLDNDI